MRVALTPCFSMTLPFHFTLFRPEKAILIGNSCPGRQGLAGSLTVANHKKCQKAYDGFIFLSIFLFLYCVQYRTML